MAVRIGKLCGDGGSLWIGMQRDFDLATAEHDLAEEVANIPTLKVA